jgi:hypothetical protein
MSFYEKFNLLTTVAKQRVVETFSGDALDTDRWATTGTGTFGMNDSVDGGFNVATLSTTNNDNYISFGGIGQYEETGSVIIWVSKVSHTTNISAQLGLRENGNGTQRSTCNVDATVVAGNFYLACVDGSGSTSTSSTVTSDTNWHVHKIENSSTNVKLTTDGVLKVTTTTNRPTVPLEPSMENFTYNTTIKNVSMKYCEAYNT